MAKEVYQVGFDKGNDDWLQARRKKAKTKKASLVESLSNVSTDTTTYGREDMSDLRKKIIRLAHAKPALRKHLLPLLQKSAGRYPDEVLEVEDMEDMVGPLTLTSQGGENIYFTDGDGNDWFYKAHTTRDERRILRYMSNT